MHANNFRAGRTRRSLVRRVAATITTTGLLCAGLAFGLASEAEAAESATLEQCGNGGVGGPVQQCTGSNWQNGNLGQASSQYTEGSSVPFRILLGDLSLAPATNTLVIEWDTTHSADKHTYDYLTSYNRTETDADPCSGIASCNPVVFTTFAIPADPNIPGDPNWSGTQIPGSFTMFGGTITGVSAYSLSAPYGSGQSSTQITISFTADVIDPVLSWAGHVASQDNWGAGHAAADIPGSPYHMRLLSLNGTGGNQDRSLSVSTPAPAIRIVQDTQPDDAQDFGFTFSGPGLFSDVFTLDDDLDASISDTHTLTDLANGTYTITQGATPGWALTGVTCTGGSPVVDLSARSVTLTINNDFPNCTFVNEQRATITIIQDTVPNSAKDIGFTESGMGTGSFTLDDDDDGTLSNSKTFVVLPGTYSATQAVVSGFPLSGLSCVTTFGTGATFTTDVGTRTAEITLADTSSVECTFTNTKASSTLAVTKTVVTDPVESLRPATFNVSIQNTAALSITISTLTDSVFGQVAPTTSPQISATSCTLPQTIAPGASYSCTFTATIQDAVGATHNDTVTASGTDEDGSSVSAEGSASVLVQEPIWNTAITVVQDSAPDAARDFSFTAAGSGGDTPFDLDDDADPTLSNTRTDTALDPGDYTITQDAVAAWPLTDITCTGGVTSVDLPNRSVTITIADGDAVSCTFTNTKTRSTLAVTKYIDPDPVASGGTATFKVAIENTSQIAVTIDALSDDVYGDVTDPSNPLLGLTACSVPQSLAPSASYSCAFSAIVTDPAGTTHRDTVTASGTDDDDDPVSADGTGAVDVVEPIYTADVKVEKNVAPTEAEAGTHVMFTMIVTNLGPDQANDVALDEVLPTGLTYISSTASAGTYDASAKTWDLGMMTMNQDETLTVEAMATADATNTATVSTSSIDPDPDNNLSVAGVTVTAAATPVTGALPLTGISGTLLLSGLVAVLGGGLMMIAARPRRRSA